MKKPIKIVIFGQYKTGTTALFYKIRQSLPENCRELFEQTVYKEESGDNNRFVLAKTILGIPTPDFSPNYYSFFCFDKKLLLIRDPRDWLISGLLFLIQQERNIWANDTNLNYLIGLFEEKEKNPHAISVRSLLEAVIAKGGFPSLMHTMKNLEDRFAWLLSFELLLEDYLIVRYEDLVEDTLSEMDQYLGLSSKGEAIVPEVHSHVPRTKNYGNWRHWFVKEDCDFFRSLFQPYIKHYSYPSTWEISENPVINPEHCSAYIRRVTTKRRKEF